MQRAVVCLYYLLKKESTYQVQQQLLQSQVPHHLAFHYYDCGLEDGSLLGIQLHRYQEKVKYYINF